MREEGRGDQRERPGPEANPPGGDEHHAGPEQKVVSEGVMVALVGVETEEQEEPVDIGDHARDQTPESGGPVGTAEPRDRPADERMRQRVEDSPSASVT